jgi:hypothetical protein
VCECGTHKYEELTRSTILNASGNVYGNSSSWTDFSGHTTAYTYNSMNQWLSKPPDPFFHASAVPCAYWPQGRYTTTDASTLTRYNFDNSHRSSGVSERAGSLS